MSGSPKILNDQDNERILKFVKSIGYQGRGNNTLAVKAFCQEYNYNIWQIQRRIYSLRKRDQVTVPRANRFTGLIESENMSKRVFTPEEKQEMKAFAASINYQPKGENAKIVEEWCKERQYMISTITQKIYKAGKEQNEKDNSDASASASTLVSSSSSSAAAVADEIQPLCRVDNIVWFDRFVEANTGRLVKSGQMTTQGFFVLVRCVERYAGTANHQIEKLILIYHKDGVCRFRRATELAFLPLRDSITEEQSKTLWLESFPQFISRLRGEGLQHATALIENWKEMPFRDQLHNMLINNPGSFMRHKTPLTKSSSSSASISASAGSEEKKKMAEKVQDLMERKYGPPFPSAHTLSSAPPPSLASPMVGAPRVGSPIGGVSMASPMMRPSASSSNKNKRKIELVFEGEDEEFLNKIQEMYHKKMQSDTAHLNKMLAQKEKLQIQMDQLEKDISIFKKRKIEWREDASQDS